MHDQAHPDGHAIWREFRALLESAPPPERVSIAEIHVFDPVEWAEWFGAALDEFHLPFNFSLLRVPWDAAAVARTVRAFEARCPGARGPTGCSGTTTSRGSRRASARRRRASR